MKNPNDHAAPTKVEQIIYVMISLGTDGGITVAYLSVILLSLTNTMYQFPIWIVLFTVWLNKIKLSIHFDIVPRITVSWVLMCTCRLFSHRWPIYHLIIHMNQIPMNEVSTGRQGNNFKLYIQLRRCNKIHFFSSRILYFYYYSLSLLLLLMLLLLLSLIP